MPPKQTTTSFGKGKARRARRNSMDDFVVPDDTIFYESVDEATPSKKRPARKFGKANNKASAATEMTLTGGKPTAELVTTTTAPATIPPTPVASSMAVSTERALTTTPSASTSYSGSSLATPTLTPTNRRKIAPLKAADSKPIKAVSANLASLLHPNGITVDPFPSPKKPEVTASAPSASKTTPSPTTPPRHTSNASMPQAPRKKTTSQNIQSIGKPTPVASQVGITAIPKTQPADVPVKTPSQGKTPSSKLCDRCRARKVRCSGPPGVCVNCMRLQQPCTYSKATAGKTPTPSIGEKSDARTFAKDERSAEAVSYPVGISFMLADLFDRVLEHPEEEFNDIWEEAEALGASLSAMTIVEATIVVGLDRTGFHDSEPVYHVLLEHLRKPLKDAMEDDEGTAMARKVSFLTQAGIGFVKTDKGFTHRNLSFPMESLRVDLFLSYYLMAILARMRYQSLPAMVNQQVMETRTTSQIGTKTTTDSTSTQKRRQIVEDSEDDVAPLSAKKGRYGSRQAPPVPDTIMHTVSLDAVQGLRAFCATPGNSEEAPSYAAIMAEVVMRITGAKLLVKAGSSVQSSVQEAMPSTGFIVAEDLDRYGKARFAWWYNTGTTMENLYRLLQGLLQEEGTFAIPDTEGRLIPIEKPNFQVSRSLAPLVALVDKNKTEPFYSPFIDSLLADFGIYVGQTIFSFLDHHFRAILSDETKPWVHFVLPMDFTFALCVLQALSQIHATAFRRTTGGDDRHPSDGIGVTRDVQEDSKELRGKGAQERLIVGGTDPAEAANSIHAGPGMEHVTGENGIKRSGVSADAD